MLTQVLDAAREGSVGARVTKIEIVPTTRDRANQVAFGDTRGAGKAGVYLVVIHGHFVCESSSPIPLATQDCGYGAGSVEVEIVNEDYTVGETSLDNIAPDLSTLGPVTRVTP